MMAGSIKCCRLAAVLNICVRPLSFSSHCMCSEQSRWKTPTGFDTGVKVQNSLCSKDQGVSLVPLILPHGKLARWYACGPTVYDAAHIGHASSYVRFDIIRRILENFFDVRVIQVMGITDIDDKIIKRAKERQEDFKELTRREEARFLEDMAAVKVKPAAHYTRVTDFMPAILSFITRIMNNGYAYATPEGSVYFDVKSFGTDRYGKLHRQDSEDGGQETAESEKRHPQDFALWKAAKEGEPWWTSPWGLGRGRPGWHIECSAMASAIFGESLDIHTGGIDLAFPHHTNEIAQCEGCFQTNQWANYFFHSGHLFLKQDSDKMSKSLGNVISVPEFLHSYTANQLRTLCMLMRYNRNIEYSDDSLNKAVSTTNQISSFLSDCEAYVRGQINGGSVEESLLQQSVSETSKRIRHSFANDFDTPRALQVIMDLIKSTNAQLRPSKQSSCPCSARSPATIAFVGSFVSSTLESLGFDLRSSREDTNSENALKLSNTLDTLVSFRNNVRKWALSSDGASNIAGETPNEQKKRTKKERGALLSACDEVRSQLSEDGIRIKDRGENSTWEFSEKRSNQAQQKQHDET